MGSSQPPEPAPAIADDVCLLITAWLSARRSENTRTAYARDIGITPQQRPSRAPSWLTWCQQHELHPVTGITALHMARYARQLDDTELSPASAARKLAAISSWYAWLARRGHITASPATGIARPRSRPATQATPALTPGQALAFMHAADTAPGPRRTRTAALVAVLLFTSARLADVTSAAVADLGTSGGRRVLRVTRANGRRQDLPLPDPAAARVDAYLAGRASQAGDQALFATRTGRQLYAADVRRTLRRLATRAGLPSDQARHLGPRTIRQSLTTQYVQALPAAGLHSSTRQGQVQPRHRHPQLHGTYQARDPDPPWPRRRPHCRARRPQHPTRHTRPRLLPRKTPCGRPYHQLKVDEAPILGSRPAPGPEWTGPQPGSSGIRLSLVHRPSQPSGSRGNSLAPGRLRTSRRAWPVVSGRVVTGRLRSGRVRPVVADPRKATSAPSTSSRQTRWVSLRMPWRS